MYSRGCLAVGESPVAEQAESDEYVKFAEIIHNAARVMRFLRPQASRAAITQAHLGYYHFWEGAQAFARFAATACVAM